MKTKPQSTTTARSKKSAPAAPPPKARRLEDIARGRAGAFPITPTLIKVAPGFNGRQDFGDLSELADSIEKIGLQIPLIIRKDPGTEDIWLDDGERRLRAITTILIPQGRWPQDAEDPSLPGPVLCLAEKRGTKPIDRLFMQLACNSGKPFTFLEEALLFQRILAEEPTLKPADIARRTGKTKQAISDSLRLVNDGCPALLQEVRSGTLAASTAVQIIKANPDPAAQKSALAEALSHAKSAGRSHVMPKDLTPKPTPTPDPEPSSTPPSSSSLESSSLGSCVFNLYLIEGAPDKALESSPHLYFETDRFVLENPQLYGLDFLHLLCAATDFGPAYGYRIPEHEQLPDVSGSTLQADPQEGFTTALEIAASKAALTEEQLQELSDLLFDALCDYFPESGKPKEPQRISFAGAPPPPAPGTTPDAQGNTGFDAIRNAPSGGGGGSRGGDTGYAPPDKQLDKIEKILEDLAEKGKGIEDRITTADIIVGILRNERPIQDLRNHLTGK